MQGGRVVADSKISLAKINLNLKATVSLQSKFDIDVDVLVNGIRLHLLSLRSLFWDQTYCGHTARDQIYLSTLEITCCIDGGTLITHAPC